MTNKDSSHTGHDKAVDKTTEKDAHKNRAGQQQQPRQQNQNSQQHQQKGKTPAASSAAQSDDDDDKDGAVQNEDVETGRGK
jgi:hypothetical protein